MLYREGLTWKEAERDFILEALKVHGWNRTMTAKALKMGLRTLRYKILDYQYLGFEIPRSQARRARRT